MYFLLDPLFVSSLTAAAITYFIASYLNSLKDAEGIVKEILRFFGSVLLMVLLFFLYLFLFKTVIDILG